MSSFAHNFLKKSKINPLTGLQISTTSELIHQKCIEKVEKLVQNLYIIIKIVVQNCVIWPTFIVSFVTYFTTDLQSEAFQLPFYIW